jgi:hypothetical protein
MKSHFYASRIGISAYKRGTCHYFIRLVCFVCCGIFLFRQLSILPIQTSGTISSADLAILDLPFLPNLQQKHDYASSTSTSSQPSSLFVVDILSIGSQSRLDYVVAQQQTFGSHVSVRNFFNVTELDDADPTCSFKLTREDVVQISNFCRVEKKWHPRRQFVMSYLQAPFARPQWLMKRKNPMGWMCAQTRPAQGFYKVVQHYRSTKQPLPDYLIIMDDDTYYNLELFQQHFQTHERYRNSSESSAIAGCLVRSPIQHINLILPFGGYGLIVSKGYLQDMMRPISCSVNRNLCRAIRLTSHLDERHLFSESMSLTDLLYAYATNQPFADYKNWTTGFCLHSDW